MSVIRKPQTFRVLKPQTQARESPARKLAPQPSMLVKRPFAGSAVGQARVPAGTIGNQAMLRYLAQQRSNLPADTQEAALENITAREPSAGAGLAARAYDSQRPKVLESPGEQEPDADLRNLQPPPGPGSGSGGAPGGGSAAPSASLSVSSAGYVDSATASRKTVTFNATWSGGAKEDYILVQWFKGYMKQRDGTPFKAKLYGKSVDVNATSFQIDSPDADPAYFSKGGTRWRYNVGSGNSFSAYDAPGPMYDADGAGAKAQLDFKIAVYKSADVPATTTGTIAAAPISSWQSWSYNVNVLGGGKFSHS